MSPFSVSSLCVNLIVLFLYDDTLCNELPRHPVNQWRMFCSIPKTESSQLSNVFIDKLYKPLLVSKLKILLLFEKTCELKCSGLIGCNHIVVSDTTEIPAVRNDHRGQSDR